MGFPLRDKITGGYPIKMTYILTQNGIAIPVHFKFFRVYNPKCQLVFSGVKNSLSDTPYATCLSDQLV